ncbi:MAG: MarR family transcriptional regulator [Candidatus Aenigmarchaeota archaeon]|nr:MarR family transcriptional regulator [Candidatus Aenigmarchaeota archaeon]
MKNEYRNYNIVMILCLIIGGFSLILYLFQFYDAFWRVENFPRFENMTGLERPFRNMTFEANRSFGRDLIPLNPMGSITSPSSFMLLLNGIFLLVSGISIWRLTREKELASAKEKITSLLLLPEERMIINELKKAKGSITQSQLVRNTGLSKVKMHRIVSRLAAKGIIKKYPYGLTNKIVLEKDV